mgnify:FL=1|jgi:hypothetical protein
MVLEKVSDIDKIRDDQGEEDEGEICKEISTRSSG